MNSDQIASDAEMAKKLQQQYDNMDKKPEQNSFLFQMPGQQSVPYPDPLAPPQQPPYAYQPPKPERNFEAVINRVVQMPLDSKATRLAGQHGLTINSVTWEDNARSKNSSWGPCISDMTLKVQDHNLPVIRSPNYQDLTWDVPIERVPLLVGNENGLPLRPINLKQYLEKFTQFLRSPLGWKSLQTSLLAPRDSHVLMSSQACLLPIQEEGGEAPFNVSIFNYQSSRSNPAVLAIVANERGTSAQLIEHDGHGGQKLYFNNDGKKCSFLGERLSQHRIEKGEAHNLGKPMTEEEKQKNMLVIIQVPLKHRIQPPRGVCYSAMSCVPCAPAPQMNSLRKKSCALEEKADIEDAIVKVGESEGEFPECINTLVERDPNYPLRVTLQYYKATSNGVADETHMSQISQQLKESRKFGEAIGSLVVGGNTGRVTEPTISHQMYQPAPWWDDFWSMYKGIYPQFTSETAAKLVFAGGRYSKSSMTEVTNEVLDILGRDQNPAPKWGMFG